MFLLEIIPNPLVETMSSVIHLPIDWMCRLNLDELKIGKENAYTWFSASRVNQVPVIYRQGGLTGEACKVSLYRS
jgi:hypothetical protein